MRRVLAIAGLIGVVGLPLHAAGAPAWLVDTGKSSVSFRYVEDGVAKDGAFVRFSANVKFDPDRVEDTEAAFAVDTASIDLNDALREGVLVTTPWFDSTRFPHATFELLRIYADGTATGVFWADGVLTIKDVKKPVRFRTTVDVDDKNARARGNLMIDRTAFRLRDVVLESIVPVGDEVDIAFDLVARRVH